MEHFQENHRKALNELCRCCGNLNFTAKQKKTGSYPSLVCDRAGDILSIFDICVAEDEEGKHSRHVCYTCVSKMRRAKSNSVGAVKSARLSKNNSSHIWCHFVAGDVSACSVCAHRRPIVLSFGTIKKQKAVQHNSCEININGNEYMETNFLIQSPSINPVQEVPLFLRQLRHANQSPFFSHHH